MSNGDELLVRTYILYDLATKNLRFYYTKVTFINEIKAQDIGLRI